MSENRRSAEEVVCICVSDIEGANAVRALAALKKMPNNALAARRLILAVTDSESTERGTLKTTVEIRNYKL